MSSELESLTKRIVGIRVSSVFNDDKQFRKQHLIDGQPDTCWNSDEGKSHFMTFRFDVPVNIRRVDVTFQGGFAAKSLAISTGRLSSTNNGNSTSSTSSAAVSSLSTNGADDSTSASAAQDDNTSSSSSTPAAAKLLFGRPVPFTADDSNRQQSFSLSADSVDALKITMTNMSDFFGRVIVYAVDVLGGECPSSASPTHITTTNTSS